MISVHDFTNKILPRGSYYIAGMSCDQSLVTLVFIRFDQKKRLS